LVAHFEDADAFEATAGVSLTELAIVVALPLLTAIRYIV
jgi:hypothetical protein